MDHLPIPKKFTGKHLAVPYICTQHYLGGAFVEYPNSRSVDVESLRKDSYSPEEAKFVHEFLQEWFFFGLVQEIYGRFRVTDDDFILNQEAGTRVLDTSRLNSLARRWIHGHSQEQTCRYGAQLLVLLQHVAKILETITVDEVEIEIQPAILWSIYALAVHVEAVVIFETGLLKLFSNMILLEKVTIHSLETLHGTCLISIEDGVSLRQGKRSKETFPGCLVSS